MNQSQILFQIASLTSSLPLQFFIVVLLVFIAEVAGAVVILVFKPLVSCIELTFIHRSTDT